MDTKSRVLVGLGAATAANCIPCFEQFHVKAKEQRIPDNEVSEAVELGLQMKGGANMDMRRSIQDIMGEIKSTGSSCCGKNDSSSCGC